MNLKIERKLNSEGQIVLFANGKEVCSVRDPLSEASAWVDFNAKLVQDINFVVGIGAGHHLIEIARRYPKTNFFVFDLISDYKLNFYQSFNQVPPNLAFVILESPTDLFSHNVMSLLAGRPVNVLPFRASWGEQFSEYHHLMLHLTGRSQLGLNFSAQKSQLDQFIPQVPKEPLTIKDILNHSEQVDPIFRCLGELIK